MTALEDSIRKSLKSRNCEECGQTIKAGERYHRYVGTWEGDFFTNNACLHCSAARKIVAQLDDYYLESYYGGLHEWLDDYWQDGTVEARLLVGFRAQWVYRSGRPMPIPRLVSPDPKENR